MERKPQNSHPSEGISIQSILIQLSATKPDETEKIQQLAEMGIALAERSINKKAHSRFLWFLGDNYLTLQNPETAFDCFSKSLNLALLQKDNMLIGNACYGLARVARINQDKDRFLSHYQMGIAHAQKAENLSVYFKLQAIKGAFHADRSEFQEAFEMFQTALPIAEKLRERSLTAACLLNMGFVLTKINQPERATSYINRSIPLFKKMGDTIRLIFAYNQLGCAFLTQKQFSEAQKMFSKGLKLAILKKNGTLEQEILNNLGICHEKLGNYELALKYLNESISEGRKLTPHNYVASIINIGTIYRKTNQPAKALRFFKRGIRKAEEYGFLEFKKNALNEISLLYADCNKFKKAYLYNLEFIDLKDRLLNETNSKNIAELETRYETEKKETEKEIYRLRNVELKEKNKIIREAKRNSDELLLNILPKQTASELKKHGTVKALKFSSVSVLFVDISGFTKIASAIPPEILVYRLNELFSAFDLIVGRHCLEKIKTIGDSYMAAGGLPKINESHPHNAVLASIEMLKFAAERNRFYQSKREPEFELRIGINSGHVVAGIVGLKKFQYDIWGDTVNIASRMESSGEAGKINISQTTWQLVKDKPDLEFEFRGKITAKGKGELKMYFVKQKQISSKNC